MECPIWKTPCTDLGSNDRYDFVDSPRAGGKYKLFGSGTAQVLEMTPEQKALLTSWMVKQRRFGISIPKITDKAIEEASRFAPMSFTEKVDAALLFIGSNTKIGEPIVVRHSNPLAYMLLAHAECAEIGNGQSLLKLMTTMGYILENVEAMFSLMPGGWKKYEDLKTVAIDSSQAFIAMWFDDSLQEPYENGLRKAIYDSGYDPLRVDPQYQHLNKVDDEIIAEIRRSRFLVADFTCEPSKVRGGVYFEAGFAMGLNIPIIWTCKAASISDLHFDTRQYPHIPWKDSADLYKQLKARIGALIGDGPKRRA
jgi:hypothetical protein